MEDKTKKRQIIIATVMIAAIIFYIGNSMLEKSLAKGKKMAVKKAPVTVVAKRVKAAATTTPVAVVEQKQPAVSPKQEGGQEAGWGTNPFTGKSIAAGLMKGAAFKLSGICYNKHNPRNSYAIIDDSIVKAADTIGNSKIVVKKITESAVILSDGSREWTLKLW